MTGIVRHKHWDSPKYGSVFPTPFVWVHMLLIEYLVYRIALRLEQYCGQLLQLLSITSHDSKGLILM